jgi:8-oxo-dGTP diphosphatase
VVTALVREAKEEIGVIIDEDDVKLAHVMHNSSGKGRIAFFFAVDRWQGSISNMEPEKCSELRWFPTTRLPEQMINYARVAIENYVNGRPMSLYGW